MEAVKAAKVERRWDRVWLIALWVIVTAYNLFKPYHIDDTAYLEIARWISTHPLHPMSGLVNWSGIDQPIWHLNQPHLYFYLLALWGATFGYSEAAMHAMQSLPALACIFLFYRLARIYLGPTALWATSMLILGPAFVVEQNLMVDVPLLATWLTFFNFLVSGVNSSHQNRRYGLAALAVAAALLIKYSSLVLLVILCLSLVLERRKAQAWTVLIPLSALAAWSLFNFLDYGGVHILYVAGHGAHRRWELHMLQAAFAWVLAIGALTPLGLIVAVGSKPELTRVEGPLYGIALLCFATLIGMVASGILSDTMSDRLLWAIFVINGALLCLALIPGAINLTRHLVWQADAMKIHAPSIYLWLWVMGTTAFYALFAPFIAARHVLLILPALTLLLVSHWNASLSQKSKLFGLTLTVIVSAGLCLSDWRFAEFYKQQAESLARSLSTTHTIWTSGHWGWQWYATQNGFREVDVRSSKLRPGDYFILANNVDHQPLMNPPHMRKIRVDIQKDPLLNLVCSGRNARFYASSYRVAPWSLSRHCLNRITVFRVDGAQ